MRQSGVLAAAGLVALREMRHRLPEDHARARRFAESVARIGPYSLDLSAVETNIVFFDTGRIDAARIVEAGKARDILLYAVGPRRMRIVTHHDVDDECVDRLIELLTVLAR
jgi:threonine aldolase